jgi:hypothetical protein
MAAKTIADENERPYYLQRKLLMEVTWLAKLRKNF